MLVLPYHNRELIMVRASPPTAVKSSTSTLFFYEVQQSNIVKLSIGLETYFTQIECPPRGNNERK
jgi:hypothetical protein